MRILKKHSQVYNVLHLLYNKTEGMTYSQHLSICVQLSLLVFCQAVIFRNWTRGRLRLRLGSSFDHQQCFQSLVTAVLEFGRLQ